MEAMERRGKLATIAAIVFIVFCSQCRVVEGQRNNTKMSYVCPPQFIRLGHSCYYFSEDKASWQNALFACTDRDSNLTVPARWEDRNLRKYLNKPDVVKASRWIGGIFDIGAKSWRWGGDLRRMHYQSFSKMKKMSAKELEWHCIAMMPELLYRWSPRNCIEARHYICQTKLQKVPKAKVKDLRRRWQRMGKINEITAPSVSRETKDPIMINDVTINPVTNPKSYDLRPKVHRGIRVGQKRHGPKANANSKSKSSAIPNSTSNAIPISTSPFSSSSFFPTSKYDLRPNELKKRSRAMVRRRLKRPFPGYTWNRRDPEGSYQRNADLLRSGRTGLTPQQINGHLARLRHLRDKQVARRKRVRNNDWLVNEPRQALAQTYARTYTVDNNISALHPKTIVEEFNMDFPHHSVGPPKKNDNSV